MAPIHKCTEGMPIPEFKEKHLRTRKLHILTLILVLFIIIQAVVGINLYGKYSIISSDYENLKAQHNSLQSSYDTLNADYTSLQSQHNALQQQYDNLRSEYTSLQSSYNALVSRYDQMRYQINLRSQHYDITKFITPDDPSVQQIANQITGGWSDPSDWNEFWSDVKAMYNWVANRNNIEYRHDGLFPILPVSLSGSISYASEIWQFPNETLNIRKGDCEDMAILLCSMIRYYHGERYWTECVWITGSNGAHVGVQLPVSGGKLVLLDPSGQYYTSDIWGNITPTDISTEINNWLNYWKSTLGSDVRVYRVFANYMDQTFYSTREYISWMYSR